MSKHRSSPIASTQAQDAVRKLCTQIVGKAPQNSERRIGGRRFKWYSYNNDTFSVKNVHEMYIKFANLVALAGCKVTDFKIRLTNADPASRIHQGGSRGISITIMDSFPNFRLTKEQLATLIPESPKPETGSNWTDNTIQFPRVIAEANAMGAFTPKILRDMAESMDCTPKEVQELIDRGETEFEKWKRSI